jgi:hypothetical protein
MSGIVVQADLSGIGGFVGGIQGLIEAIQDPRAQDDFLGHVMDRTRTAFYAESLAAMESGAANIKHVYEWGEEQGEVSDVRLFKLTKGGQGSQRYMGFAFLPSTKPVPLPDPSRYGFPAASKSGKTLRRHIFYMKALVMETKSSVIIKPRMAKKLFIPDATKKKGFFMAPSAHVNPGGPQATGGFADWWTRWFEARAPQIAKEQSEKAEELIAATGQKIVRYAAGTKMGGVSVGGRFASGQVVSYGNINAAKATARMEALNTFRRVWTDDENVDEGEEF